MEFRRFFWIGAALLLPLGAVARPAYLKCKLDGNEKSFIVTVDEENARVIMPSGPVYDGAQFTATEINFGRKEQSRVSMSTDEFTIDRQTLSYRNTYTQWLATDGKKSETIDTGQCEVTKPPERKI